MEANRAAWNLRHKELRAALNAPDRHEQAVALFLEQHACVHTAQVSQSGGWSFEDEVMDGLSEGAARRIPGGGEQSIVWILWHAARIEDVTMNLLAAGCPQVLVSGGWAERLKIARMDTGNLMRAAEIVELSAAVDLDALRAYRAAVGRQTREIVPALSAAELRARVRPERLRRAVDESAVRAEVSDLLAYWGGLTTAGLLLMPPTRHNFVHLNEALRIKKKVI